MKKKLYLLGLILMLGLGGSYAASLVFESRVDPPKVVCYWDGQFRKVGEAWTVEQDGKTIVCVCREDGQIYCYELPDLSQK